MSADVEATSTDLAAPIERPASTAIMTPEQFDSTWRMSKALAQSGSFKDIGREDGSKALARILMGADLGMSPTQSLMGIDIVKGNPQIRGVALGRMVRLTARKPTPTGESYDYRVLDRGFEKDAEYAVVALYRKDEDGTWPRVEDPEGETFPTSVGLITIREGQRLPEAVESFKLDQARKRKLIKSDGAWESQPEVMCVWRALSQAVRFYAPDVIGGMSVYTEADGLRAALTTPAGGADPEWSGWEGLSPGRAEECEALVGAAASVGHAGLADRHSVLMRVQGMTDQAFAVFIADAQRELDAMLPQSSAGNASVSLGGETFYFQSEMDDLFVMLAAVDTPDSMLTLAAEMREAADHESDMVGRERMLLMADALVREASPRQPGPSDPDASV